LCYKDAANLKSNQKNLGTIKSSNLCVAPDTKILTSEGEKTISDLEDQIVKVWNGEVWSEVQVLKTSASSELLRVWTTKHNKYIDCTHYHKFHLQNGTVVEAKDLRVDDCLKEWVTPDGVLMRNEKVLMVQNTGRVDATYCFNEPLKHVGIFNGILTGNCSEIIEYSDTHESAVCNLGSIALPAFFDYASGSFDFQELHRVSQILTRNLNKVIDRTFYPIPETKLSNLKHRPIGIGVQGLADVYALMRYPFDSPEAAQLNRDIFETIYHGALTASIAISKKRTELFAALDSASDADAKELLSHLKVTDDEWMLPDTYRGAYSSFIGSPAHQGLLQYDMWDVTPSDRWDWVQLKANLNKYGLRNSLLLAPMPTASTSQILGNTECFEPVTSNIFQRQTLAGEFTIINKHLVKDLISMNLWSVDMKNRILAGGGSIQHIIEIPEALRALYKTAWELKQRVLIDQAADRGAFVCQSQSLNLFVEDAEFGKLTAMHFHAWKAGLKTGCYYLRTRPKAKMTAYSLTPDKETAKEDIPVCRRDNPDCLMCSG
jgi:ribonucleoside-diphosphate reductase alpha chain